MCSQRDVPGHSIQWPPYPGDLEAIYTVKPSKVKHKLPAGSGDIPKQKNKKKKKKSHQENKIAIKKLDLTLFWFQCGIFIKNLYFCWGRGRWPTVLEKQEQVDLWVPG